MHRVTFSWTAGVLAGKIITLRPPGDVPAVSVPAHTALPRVWQGWCEHTCFLPAQEGVARAITGGP